MADWSMIAKRAELAAQIPLVLAGGLTPENVAAAIRAVRPAAVDVASGVETDQRTKSHALMSAFAAEAKRGFDELELGAAR